MDKKPVRVLQYIGSLNSGGSQSMIMNIYRNIDRNLIQFDFIVDRKNELMYKDEINRLGGRVFVFEEYFNGFNIISYKKQWKKFFLENNEYSIIHCHVRSVAAIILKIAKKAGLITICHSHSTSNGSGIKAIVKKKLQKNIKKYCHYFFACSKESAIWLYGKEIANSNNCYIINNAIDTKLYIYNNKIREKIRKKYNIENRIVLGQVGRLEEVKNPTFTIELIKELVKKNDNYYLILIGSGKQKEMIFNKILELNIENNVMMLEGRNDVNEILQAMDLFLMPSLWEGLSLALIEAQASSLPCLISDNITDGILSNRLVYKKSIKYKEEWVKEIQKIIDLKIERKNEMDTIISKGFDINKNVDIITCLYLNMMKKSVRK